MPKATDEERARRAWQKLQLIHRNRQYIPHLPTPKQAAFLALDCEEAMYGGAAGGGKSDAGLMAALQYVHIPGYKALILRRSYKDLSLPEAIMARAHEWLRGTDARWHADTKTYTFPTVGDPSSITFGYLANAGDHLQYQGAAFTFVFFDELTQFARYQYRYLFSRLRRLVGLDVPIRMRSATNPGGPGHDWVKKWFIVKRKRDRAFIPAKLDENPHLDSGQYERALKKLDPVTRARLLKGDWFVGESGLMYPDFASCSCEKTEVPWGLFKSRDAECFGGLDWGFNNPFAAVRAVLDKDDVLWLIWCRYKRHRTVAQNAARLPRDDAHGASTLWFADPSRPENILELKQADFAVQPGPNDREAGIDIVRERIGTKRLRVLSTLTPIFEEAGLYRDGTTEDEDEEDEDEDDGPDEAEDEKADPEDAYDATGDTAPEDAEKKNDHLMDAIRYMCAGVAKVHGSRWADELADHEDEDDDERAAREAAEEKAEQEELRKFRRINNPHWWGPSGG